MYRKNLEIVFDQYLKRFDEFDANPHNEGFKWEAFSCFAENWDLDARNFPGMFKATMEQVSSLLQNAHYLPVDGIQKLLKQESEVEFVRQCFRELLVEDNNDLDGRLVRIRAFMEKINDRMKKLGLDLAWYQQDLRAAIAYLCFWKPAENYLYKPSTVKHWANCVEFDGDFGHAISFSLKHYYRMCDELLQEVRGNKALMEISNARFEKRAHGFDDAQHLLVYEIMFCTEQRKLCYALPFTAEERAKVLQLRKLMAAKEKKCALLWNTMLLWEKAIADTTIVGAEVTMQDPFRENTILHGTVVACDHNEIMQVSFAEGMQELSYPTCIKNGRLTIVDENLREQIFDALAKQEELGSEQEKHRTEMNKRRNLKKALAEFFYEVWRRDLNGRNHKE